MVRNFLVVLALIGLFGLPAAAGFIIDVRTADQFDRSPAKMRTVRMAIEGERLFLQDQPEEGESPVDSVIYHGDSATLYLINHATKSYRVLRRAESSGKPRPAAPAWTELGDELVKTDTVNVINGYPCRRYFVNRDGERLREHWVTDWNEVASGKQPFETSRSMAALLTELSPASGPGSFGAGLSLTDFQYFSGLDGLPVMLKHWGSSKLHTWWAIHNIERAELPPETFAVPEGYERIRSEPTTGETASVKGSP